MPANDAVVRLTLKRQPEIPLEAENISPDVIAPLGLDELRALPLFLGKRQYRLDGRHPEYRLAEYG